MECACNQIRVLFKLACRVRLDCLVKSWNHLKTPTLEDLRSIGAPSILRAVGPKSYANREG